MGNITFSKFEEEEARKTLKLLLKLFKEKNIHEDHLLIYQFIIFYGTMFLETKEALDIIYQMQSLMESKEKTLN